MATRAKSKKAEEDTTSLEDKLDHFLSLYKAQDSKLNAILERVNEIDSDIKSIKNEVNNLKDALNFQVEELQTLKDKIQECAETKTIQILQDKIEDLENRSKRNNLVFWNFPEGTEKSYGNCETLISSFFKDHMQINDADDIAVECAHRSGTRKSLTKDGEQRARPIHVKILHWADKERVLKQAAKCLKDKPFKGNAIFISDYVSRKVREERATLKTHLPTIRGKKGVEFAYIPWLVPARIIYKKTDGHFYTHYMNTKISIA